MILQPAKVATPLLGVSGLVVQASVPPGLVPMARVIDAAELVTVLPEASSTVTTGWVVQAAPLAPPPGWVVKTSWVAGAEGDVEGIAGGAGETRRWPSRSACSCRPCR